MDPCIHHSGIEAKAEAQADRVREVVDGQKRIHDRIDQMQETVLAQIGALGKVLTDPETGIVNGKDGIMARMDRMERGFTMCLKIGGWVLAIIGASIGLFREQLGKFAKWFFFGG